MQKSNRLSTVFTCSAIMLLGNGVVFATETVFTDTVRIQTPLNPYLTLDATAGTVQAWQLYNNNGGQFLIYDVTKSHQTFVIDPGSPSGSIKVQNNGNVGFGTFFPQANVHIYDYNKSPTLRFEADTGTPQTWDLVADHAGFDLVDVTNGGHTPFSVLPGAPSNSLLVTTVGRVGMGTFNPIQKLHVKGRVFADNSGSSRSTGIQFSNGDSGGVARYGIGMGPTNLEGFLEYSAGNGNTAAFGHRFLINGSVAMVVKGSGNVGLGVAAPTNPLQLASGAKCTAGGVWTSVSSRDAKQDIEPITSEQARETVQNLQPVGYRYKNELDEQYVGFIAEDVPDLVASKDRKSLTPMDITAVLTKVVQDQDRQLADQSKQLADERQRNDQQQASLEQQRTTLEAQKQLIVRQQGLLDELTDRLTKLERQAGDDGHLAP